MVRAFIINLVAVLCKRDTVLALLICLMLSLALCFDFFEIRFKTFMLHEFVIIWQAVDALLPWTVIAGLLNFFDVIFSHSETVDALGVRAVVAVRFFNFFVCFWLIGLMFLKCGSGFR